MVKTAKVVDSGGSQAITLPAEFHLDTDEVFVRRDEGTGDLIISARPHTWDEFFRLRSEVALREDFLTDREDAPPRERNLF